MIYPFPQFCFTFGHLSHGISWAPDQMTVSQHSKSDWLHHRVDRVISFSPVVGIGTTPTPHPQASVPPPFGSGGRGTLADEKGGGRVRIPTMGHTLWYSLYIRTLWFTHSTPLPSLPSPLSPPPPVCSVYIKSYALVSRPLAPR
jgi:hypothetical protein